MKVEVRVISIEAEISIHEETGDYLLQLEMVLSDGKVINHEKLLKSPHFKIELSSAETEVKEETPSN